MAKPKLALIPCTQGYFYSSVLPSDGSGDFIGGRSGKATRINSQGLIEEVGDGISRLNYPMIDGKVVGCPHHILEPQRTNLVTYSEDFSQSYWTKSGASVTSGFISPDGTSNAFKLIEDTSNAKHRIFTNAVGTSKAFSFFAKADGRTWVSVLSNNGNSSFFDIGNGVVGTVAGGSIGKIESIGNNGWYRCTLYDSHGTFGAYIGLAESNNSEIYQGDGSSGVYIFGAMLEEGSFPTSYIKTNGSATTRSAETATGSGNADTFNDSEGVLMAEISALANDGTFRAISLNSGSPSQSIRLFYRSDINKISFYFQTNNESSYQGSVSNATDFNKLAIKYKENDTDIYINGFLVHTMTSVAMPIGLSQLDFYNNNTQPFYGKTKQIQYHNSALTDSELEQLTSWTSFTDMANGQLYTIE